MFITHSLITKLVDTIQATKDAMGRGLLYICLKQYLGIYLKPTLAYVRYRGSQNISIGYEHHVP